MSAVEVASAKRRRVAVCGTYSGYQAHRKRGEQACEPCLDANRRYMHSFRQARPDVTGQQKRNHAAYHRALVRLSHLHPDEFDALYRDERQRGTRPT